MTRKNFSDILKQVLNQEVCMVIQFLAWGSAVCLFGFVLLLFLVTLRLPGHSFIAHAFDLHPSEEKDSQ